jgi:hypothetical protein
MPKKEISYEIRNKEEKVSSNTIGLLQENILKYKEKDNTIVHFHYNENILERENDDIKLKYRFKVKEKTIGIIHIKDLKKELKVEIITKSINKTNNNIEIHYQIEDNNYCYKLEVIK